MYELLIGYARVTDDTNDLAAQSDALLAFGVSADRVYLDTGMAGALTGTGQGYVRRSRPAGVATPW